MKSLREEEKEQPERWEESMQSTDCVPGIVLESKGAGVLGSKEFQEDRGFIHSFLHWPIHPFTPQLLVERLLSRKEAAPGTIQTCVPSHREDPQAKIRSHCQRG